MKDSSTNLTQFTNGTNGEFKEIHRTTLYIMLLGIVLLGIMCSGCSSGYPRFVKFMADRRHLIYEDNRHPYIYVYDLANGKKYVYAGQVACLDSKTAQFTIRPVTTTAQMPCQLVTLGEEAPRIRKLPCVPVGKGLVPEVVLEFLPTKEGLLAAIYNDQYGGPSSYYTLRNWNEAWQSEPIPEPIRLKKHWEWYPPLGLGQRDYAYDLITDHNVVPEDQRWGPDIEEVFDAKTSDYYFKLPSPDGKWTVTIHDPADCWKRLTLTEVSTGQKNILLDKNDAACDVLDFFGRLWTSFVFTLLGVGSF